MLTIRNEQLAAFRAVVDEALARRILDHLSSTQPGTLEGLPTGAARTQIRDGIQKARTYGLTAERSLADFVVYRFTLGASFDEHPAFAEEFGRIAAAEYPDARFAALALNVPSHAFADARQRTPPRTGPSADV